MQCSFIAHLSAASTFAVSNPHLVKLWSIHSISQIIITNVIYFLKAHSSVLNLAEKWRTEIKDTVRKKGLTTDCHSESVRSQEEGGGAGEGSL